MPVAALVSSLQRRVLCHRPNVPFAQIHSHQPHRLSQPGAVAHSSSRHRLCPRALLSAVPSPRLCHRLPHRRHRRRFRILLPSTLPHHHRIQRCTTASLKLTASIHPKPSIARNYPRAQSPSPYPSPPSALLAGAKAHLNQAMV
ncbi:hypothetical protein M0R45_006702 [Rubus argutus]|uniref:Uncharacterized protein n=1 Tax=Rubus argutus TaxID=59490 RepID=A0AAW1YRB9_RUBAR